MDSPTAAPTAEPTSDQRIRMAVVTAMSAWGTLACAATVIASVPKPPPMPCSSCVITISPSLECVPRVWIIRPTPLRIITLCVSKGKEDICRIGIVRTEGGLRSRG